MRTRVPSNRQFCGDGRNLACIAPEKSFAVKPALPSAISKCAEFFIHRKELRIARHGAYLCVREYRATANSAAMGEKGKHFTSGSAQTPC